MKTTMELVGARPLIDEIPKSPDTELTKVNEVMNIATHNAWSKIWDENIKENIKRFKFHERPLRLLKDVYKDVPTSAILVGAGASLKSNYQFLNRREHLFASSHSLKFLIENRIKPKFVVIVDAKDVQADFVNIGQESKNMTLICDITTHPDVFDAWKGDILFFVHFEELNEYCEEHVSFINTGGNVIGAAYMIANVAGFKKIAFTGVDLSSGFNPDSIEYCDGTVQPTTDTMLTCDIRGIGVYCALNQYCYKQYLENFSLMFRNRVEHINATEGGILGAYLEGNLSSIKQMRLEEVQ